MEAVDPRVTSQSLRGLSHRLSYHLKAYFHLIELKSLGYIALTLTIAFGNQRYNYFNSTMLIILILSIKSKIRWFDIFFINGTLSEIKGRTFQSEYIRRTDKYSAYRYLYNFLQYFLHMHVYIIRTSSINSIPIRNQIHTFTR